MQVRTYRTFTSRRRLMDLFIKIIAFLATLLGCVMLGWILWMIIIAGLPALLGIQQSAPQSMGFFHKVWFYITSINASFFTQTPRPAFTPGGGMGNAALGTLEITGMATVLGVPLGLLAGVFLAEFGQGTKLAAAVRFCANLLMGVPSIIVGVMVYMVLVAPLHHSSAYAGAVALAIMMLPIVTRTTEDMLALVPGSMREAGLAMGAPRWKVTFQVVFRAAKVGILTGVLLSVARIAGETAPLLFTALNNNFAWPTDPNRATANLTVMIYKFAFSFDKRQNELAWAGALLITMSVLAITIISRLIIRIGSK